VQALRSIYRGSPGTRPGRASWGADFAAGRACDIRVPVKLETGRTIVTGIFLAKRNVTDDDAQAVIQKVVTTVLSASGQVTDTGLGDRKGEVLFLLTASQSLLFALPHYYSIDVTLDNGDVKHYESGQVYFQQVAAQAPAGVGVVDHIDVTPSAIGVVMGSVQLFTATVKDAAGVTLAGRVVDWFTTDSSIATVDVTGLVTTLAEGSVRIGAAVEGVVGFADLTISVDDVALFIANTGGDTRWPAFYDSRRNVRHIANAIYTWDDARCTTAGGRIVLNDDYYLSQASAVFDSATKLTVIAWYQGATNWMVAGPGTNGQFLFGASHRWDLYHRADPADVNDRYSFIVGTGGTQGTGYFELAGTVARGTNIMIGWVYDGAGATNADRLKAYYRLYDKSLGTWGVVVVPALTFVGTVPAAMPVHADPFVMGVYTAGGYRCRAYVDEARIWVGTALSQAQVELETLASTPAAAHMRWTFDGNLNNTGTLGGYTWGVIGSAPDRYASDDIRWGDPLIAWSASKPVYDPVAFTITCDGTDDHLGGMGASYRRITGDCGVLAIGTQPSWPGTTEYWWQLGHLINSNGLPASLATYIANATDLVAVAEAGGVLIYTRDTGRRLVQYRRQRAGGNITVGVKKGSAAEATAVVAEAVDTIPGRLSVAGRADQVGASDTVMRAIAVRSGDYLPAVQDAAQDWSVARHATPA
jgi:hypothetical protein